MTRFTTKETETIHIVFDRAFAGSLKHAFRKPPYASTEQVILVPDILSIGPVESLHTEQGIEKRFCWLREHVRGEYEGQQQLFLDAVQSIQDIPPHLSIIIWTSGNAAEQTGLRYAAFLLRSKRNEISEIDTAKAYLTLHTATGLHEELQVLHSGELSSEQLVEIYAYSKPWRWNNARRAAIEQEGKSLMYDESLLRTWEHDELWSSNEDRHDTFIMECANILQATFGVDQYFNVLRLIGQVIGELEQYVGDAWIEYRVREIIRQGELKYIGDIRDWRKYKICVMKENISTKIKKAVPGPSAIITQFNNKRFK